MSRLTDPKAQAADKRQAANDERIDRVVMQSLMSTVDGRRWLWLRLSEASIFADAAGLDPYTMAWEKGRRTLGLRLLAAITRHAPTNYVRMTEENIGRQLEDTDNDGHQPDAGDAEPEPGSPSYTPDP